MIFHLRIWAAYVAQFLKRRMIYELDFLAGLAADMALQVVNLLFIFVIFQKVPNLRGWSRDEVFFIYGLSIMSYGLFHAFFSNIYYLGNSYIVDGQMDRVLLRPLNPLFQVYSERVDLEDVGEMLTGLGVVIYAGSRLHIDWTWLHFVALPLFVLFGILIFLGVFTALASLGFWFVDRVGLLPPVYNMMAFGRYPVTIYNPLLRFVLSWIIPFAFIGFFPATYFLGRNEFLGYFLVTPVVALVSFGVGYCLFHLGLKRYESTGS
ncbi:MAG: ABC-2 family transporter protein [Candidatus Sumerlaeaceae bacterium]|nr:ABC-2 family transporter protein [Candidatus Sumerlaeaceae bacterium]